jgi:hypothetical protein
MKRRLNLDSKGREIFEQVKSDLKKGFKNIEQMNLGDLVEEYVRGHIQYPKGSLFEDVYKERLSQLQQEMNKYKKPDKTYTGLEGIEQF